MTTAADHVRRIVVALREAQLSANVRAVDTEAAANRVSTGKGGHGSHKARTMPTYGPDVPLYVELEAFLGHVADVVERRLEEDRAGRADLSAPAAKTGQRKRAEDRAIVAAEGVDPIDLAYIYRRSTESVRKLRIRFGLDPDTGERVRRERPLTAPACDAADDFARRTSESDPQED